MTPRISSRWMAVSLAVAGFAPAHAAPATQEEAQRLKTLFERYLGHPAADQSSAVAVVPDGENYKASLDVARLLAPLGSMGVIIAPTDPFSAVLTPDEAGNWHVTAGGFPPLSFAKADTAITFTVNGYRLDGVFDPKIETFKSATTSITGVAVHSTGASGTSDARSDVQETTLSTAKDAGGGTVNASMSQIAKDYGYKFNLSIPGSAPDKAPTTIAFDAHAAGFASNIDAKNERLASLNDLWLFLVDHPNKKSLVANQGELKTRLKALLPFLSAVTGELKATDVVVNTSLGRFSAADLSERYAFAGDDKHSVSTTLKAAGLVIPAGLVPAWASGLIPTAFDFTQDYGPFNFTSPLTTAIDDFDLSANPPLTDEQTNAITQEFASTTDMAFAIEPTTITTPLMTLKLQGEMRVVDSAPTGTGKIAVTGLDKAIDQIRATGADDPEAAQAIGFLSAMKALAKADGPDSYTWAIATAPGGIMMVNGTPLNAATPAPRAAPVAPAPPAAPAPKKKPSLKSIP